MIPGNLRWIAGVLLVAIALIGSGGTAWAGSGSGYCNCVAAGNCGKVRGGLSGQCNCTGSVSCASGGCQAPSACACAKVCPNYHSPTPCGGPPNKACWNQGCGVASSSYCTCGTICKAAPCPAGGTQQCQCNGGNTCPREPLRCHTSCKKDTGPLPYLPCHGALHCYAGGCGGVGCNSGVCADYCPNGSTYRCGGKGCPVPSCGLAICVSTALVCNSSCKHATPSPCQQYSDPDRVRTCCKCDVCCDYGDCWPTPPNCQGCCDNTCVQASYSCGTPQGSCTCNHSGMLRCCKGIGRNWDATDDHCFRCRYCSDCDSCARAHASNCPRLGDSRACFCNPSCSC